MECQNNQLTNLNVSKYYNLKELTCYSNHLSSLYLTNNSALEYLLCGSIELTALDVSKNTNLRNLLCGYKNIATLDLSQNTTLSLLDIEYMPSLTKVCVWTTPFPPEGFSLRDTGSPNVYFSTDCCK